MLKESKFQDDVVDFMRKKKCFIKPLTGSMFMAGMPDVMIINRANQIFFVEHKRWELKHNPSAAELFDLLDGPQRNLIPNELWVRKVFCPIIAIDCRDEDTIHVTTSGLDICRFSWRAYYEKLV